MAVGLGSCKPVIGVVHLPPLPGSPLYDGTDLDSLIEYGISEAIKYRDAGFDGVILENYGDKPYSMRASRIQATAMALVSSAVRRSVSGIDIGVNVLRNDAYTAFTIAVLAGLDFIRVNSLCEVRVSGEGIMTPAARSLLKAARLLGSLDLLSSGRIKVLADVDVKHSSPIASYDIEDVSRDCVDRLGFKPWALVVSGRRTGEPPSLETLRRLAAAVNDYDVNIYVGSGATVDNVRDLLNIADGIIVGSSVKRSGRPEDRVDPARASRFMQAVREARGSCQS